MTLELTRGGTTTKTQQMRDENGLGDHLSWRVRTRILIIGDIIKVRKVESDNHLCSKIGQESIFTKCQSFFTGLEGGFTHDFHLDSPSPAPAKNCGFSWNSSWFSWFSSPSSSSSDS